jgi:hypothetical protein
LPPFTDDLPRNNTHRKRNKKIENDKKIDKLSGIVLSIVTVKVNVFQSWVTVYGKCMRLKLPERVYFGNAKQVLIAAGTPALTSGSKPTLSDIAQRTGLSVATISRALHLNESPNVSHQTRERIRNIAREIGYQFNLPRVAIGSYVSENGLPEAIFCVNDEIAIGCYRGLADIGIEVPRDVLLIGFDGIVETEYQRCPITTVSAPLKQMCQLAWNFLEDRLREPGRDFQQVVLKPELVIRESTRGTS